MEAGQAGSAPPAGPVGRLQARVADELRRRGTYPRWVLLTALAGMFATSFPVTILTVSLGDIARELDTSETVLAWVVSGPLLASAVVLPILGKLGDLHGHRRVFLIGFVGATAIAALTATAWDAGSLIAFRTLAQVVGAATQPASMALIMSVTPPGERVKALGWWSLVSAGAPSIGLVAGGPLVEALGWRVIFLAQAGFAVVAVVVAVVVLGETTRQRDVRFDVRGACALAVGTAGLMFLLSQGVPWGLAHPAVLAAAAIGPLALVWFVRIEARAPSPLLPLGLFRRRNFSAPLVSSFFAGAAYMGGFVLAPLLLRYVFGYSLSAVAFIMVLRPLTFSLSSPVGGHVATRVGERATAVAGMASLTVAMAVFAFGAGTRSLTAVLVGLALQGLGNGLSRPSLAASIANSVAERDLGIAAAAERMSFQVGSAFGITALTVVYAGDNVAPAFLRAYVVGVVLAGIALAAVTFVRSEDRGGDDHDEPPAPPGRARSPAGDGAAPPR